MKLEMANIYSVVFLILLTSPFSFPHTLYRPISFALKFQSLILSLSVMWSFYTFGILQTTKRNENPLHTISYYMVLCSLMSCLPDSLRFDSIRFDPIEQSPYKTIHETIRRRSHRFRHIHS